MEPLRLDPVPARVVAWHNRLPLARRIAPAHVSSLGYVALPFAQVPGKRGLLRAFDEDFLEGVAPAAIARWAARHGQPAAEPPADGPLRAVSPAPARVPAGAGAVTLYVRTAFIDDGWGQVRVLVGAGPRLSVLGPRLWSRPRLATAGGVAAALAVGLLVALRPREAPHGGEAVALAATGAASAASAAVEIEHEPPAPHAAPAPAAHEASAPEPAEAPRAPAHGEAPAAHPPAAAAHPPPAAAHPPAAAPAHAPTPAPAPAPAAAASSPGVFTASGRPVDVEPRWGTIDLPLRPRATAAAERAAVPTAESSHEASQEAAHGASSPTGEAAGPAPAPVPRWVRAAKAAPVGPSAEAPAPPAAPAAKAPAPAAKGAAPAAPAPVTVWALSTPPFRSEAESDRASVTIAGLFQRAGLRSVRVESMQVGKQWIVVGLPFPSRDAAENAQHLLATRGVRTEPVEF